MGDPPRDARAIGASSLSPAISSPLVDARLCCFVVFLFFFFRLFFPSPSRASVHRPAGTMIVIRAGRSRTIRSTCTPYTLARHICARSSRRSRTPSMIRREFINGHGALSHREKNPRSRAASSVAKTLEKINARTSPSRSTAGEQPNSFETILTAHSFCNYFTSRSLPITEERMRYSISPFLPQML